MHHLLTTIVEMLSIAASIGAANSAAAHFSLFSMLNILPGYLSLILLGFWYLITIMIHSKRTFISGRKKFEA